MTAPCLMVQGTGSGAGKSLIVTAFGRLFFSAGHRGAVQVAEHGLSAAVTMDGAEIGRAQAAQAEAAAVEAIADMNPILLKAEADHRSELVVHASPAAASAFASTGGCA